MTKTLPVARCEHESTRLVHDENGDKRLVCVACDRTVLHRKAGSFKPKVTVR